MRLRNLSTAILMFVLIISVITIGFSETPAFAGVKVFSGDINQKPEVFVQLGHTSDIMALAVLPDGKSVLTGSKDGTMKLWDLASGKEMRTFKGHKWSVLSVAVSSDGKYALSGSGDKAVKLWDIATGQEIRTFNGLESDVVSVFFIPSGKQILAATEGGGMGLWDMATGKAINIFRAHKEGINSIALTPDGKYALSASDDHTVKLWEIAAAKEIRTFQGHTDRVKSITVSPDGKYALSGSEDYTLKLWDIQTGKEIKTLHDDKPVTSLTFSGDGKYVLSGNSYGYIKLWDIATGKLIKTLEYPEDLSGSGVTDIFPIVFLPDNKYALIGAGEILTLWDLATAKVIRKFEGQFRGDVFSVAISPDNRYLILGCGYKKPLELWDLKEGKLVRIFDKFGNVNSVVFSSDGKYILSGDESSQPMLQLWDVATGKEIRKFLGHKGAISSVAVSSDGKYALSGSEDKTMKLWDIAGGKLLRNFEGHTAIVNSVVISPDTQYALSASADESIKLWDLQTGKEVRTFKSDTGSINAIAVSPDGKFVLSADSNFSATLWEVESGKEIRKFKRKQWAPSSVSSVAFSPDGKYALSGESESLVLWNVATGEELKAFEGHLGWVNSVTFSSDGRFAVSGDSEGITIIWDMATRQEICKLLYFDNHESPVPKPDEWVVITPEGYFNASPNGAKYLNVRVGNNVYSIDNFYEKFFNPVYVASVLQGKKVEAVTDIRKGILTPPDVNIISPEPDTTFDKDTITLTVSAKDTGGGIDEIRLYHNGKAIGEDTRAVKIVPKGNEIMKTYTVTLVDGTNIFRATGFSKDRTESNPYELIVKLTAPQKDVSLYVLAIGINKYKNPALNLNYAEPDAKGIVEFFRQKGEGLFKKIEFREIYDEQATKEKIIAKLKELEDTNPQDAVLLYFAGHGENISDRWYFIPHDLTYPEREEDVKTKGISSDELSGYIKNIKAQKILMLVDTCKSGAVLIAFRGFEDRKALSQLSRSTGVHIIAASTKDQFAAEVKDLGHGVFTYTLLEGLKGKASGGSETVTVRKLMGYVEEQLPEITKKYRQEAQYPVVDSKGMDFPLVITK